METLTGSAKFYFKQGATAPLTLTDETLYPVTFPECKASFESKPNKVTIKQPVLGVNKTFANIITGSETTYTLTLSTFEANHLALLFNGPTPTSATQPTSIAVGTNFRHTGWGLLEFYNNGDTAGNPSYVHSGFKCDLYVDGSFSIDPEKPAEITIKVEVLDVSGTIAL